MPTLPPASDIHPQPRPVPDWPEQTWARIWAVSDALQAAELTRLAQQP